MEQTFLAFSESGWLVSEELYLCFLCSLISCLLDWVSFVKLLSCF